MGVHHSSSRDISALNKATIVDAAEILLAEKTPEANKDDDTGNCWEDPEEE